ncbi:hypothetical protein GCM10009411_18430 [Shewanella litoralis]|uniref:Uncharacterized protein n=1 Tax=Shewanella litoralis TaxID=2282700 RepID=A0ABQ2RBF2_9GAMM|nr:hypothetical protein GCM10009411_18430 [Shewanella litoralis]
MALFSAKTWLIAVGIERNNTSLPVITSSESEKRPYEQICLANVNRALHGERIDSTLANRSFFIA